MIKTPYNIHKWPATAVGTSVNDTCVQGIDTGVFSLMKGLVTDEGNYVDMDGTDDNIAQIYTDPLDLMSDAQMRYYEKVIEERRKTDGTYNTEENDGGINESTQVPENQSNNSGDTKNDK